MESRKSIQTEPKDKLAENKTFASQNKAIDALKTGLTLQPLDESILTPESLHQENMKRKAKDVKWWKTNNQGDSPHIRQDTSDNITPAKRARIIADKIQELAANLEKSEQALQTVRGSATQQLGSRQRLVSPSLLPASSCCV